MLVCGPAFAAAPSQELAILLVPLRVAFATVVAAVVLVPASLPMPNPVTSYVSVTRLLVVALAVKLLLAVRSGEAPRDAWRWSAAAEEVGAQ